MAVGDVKSGISSVAGSGSLAIQPNGTEEWVVHNIYHQKDIGLYLSGSASGASGSFWFDNDAGGGIYARFSFHVNNSFYLSIMNSGSTAAYIGYDGILTHT